MATAPLFDVVNKRTGRIIARAVSHEKFEAARKNRVDGNDLESWAVTEGTSLSASPAGVRPAFAEAEGDVTTCPACGQFDTEGEVHIDAGGWPCPKSHRLHHTKTPPPKQNNAISDSTETEQLRVTNGKLIAAMGKMVGAAVQNRKKQAAAGEVPGRDVILTSANTIKARAVRWVWENRIPAGMLTLLAGREGEGKSTNAYEIAARITRGDLPGEHEGEPRAVIILATEDSWAHTIVPRLIAAKADLSFVYRASIASVSGIAESRAAAARRPARSREEHQGEGRLARAARPGDLASLAQARHA